MQKTVYSLVLSDDVVAEIDRLAYRNGTNRSNMINQILADYVSYVTPEKRMHDTFRKIEDLLTDGETFQMLLGPSDTMLSVRSALAYKYNPTVRYSVELYRTPGEHFGELRVSLRSQNSSLLLYMTQFFRLWVSLEYRYLGDREYQLEDGKFSRKLRLQTNTDRNRPQQMPSSEVLGQWICDYIELFDRSLKTFFYNLENPQAAAREIERMYRSYLAEHAVIV